MTAARHQRLHGTVGRSPREDAVFRGIGGRGRIGEPHAFRVPLVFGDLWNDRLFARRQIPDNEIGAGILPLLARCRLSPSLRALPARRRRRAALTAAGTTGPAPDRSAPATSAAATGSAVAFVVGEPGRRLFRDREASDFLDRRGLPGGERHDAERAPGRPVRLTSTSAPAAFLACRR